MGSSSDTMMAWKCAVNVGFIDAYNMAKRVLPCIEMLGKLLLKQHSIIEDMFVKPGEDESKHSGLLQGTEEQNVTPAEGSEMLEEQSK